MQNFVDTLRYYTNMALHVQRRRPLAVAGHEAWTRAAAVGPLRFHLPLEFPHPADRLGHFAGLGGRQYRGHQAGRGHAAVGDLPGPAGPGGGHSRRRDQRRPRLRRRDRGGPGRPSGPEADVVHRLARSGPPGGRRLRAEPGAGQAGIGRQGGGGGLRRRRPADRPWRNWSRPSPSTPARSAATPRAGSIHQLDLRRVRPACRSGCNRWRSATTGRTTQMGPVVNEKQHDRVLGYLAAAARKGPK